MAKVFPTYLAATIMSAVAMTVLLPGCNTSGCLDNQSSIPLACFYESAKMQKVSIDSIEIGGVGAPNDSLLTRGLVPVSQVYLPLRSSYTSATFRIRYCHKEFAAIGLEDYITLTYTSEPYLVSEECGAMFRYHITGCDYTTHLIESVAITDSLITNVDVERIKIIFRASNTDE